MSGDRSAGKKHSDRADSHPRPSSQNGKDQDKEVRLAQVESEGAKQAPQTAPAGDAPIAPNEAS